MKRLLLIFLTVILCFGLLTVIALATSAEPESETEELYPEDLNTEDIELVTETMDITSDGSGLDDVLDMDNEELFAGYLNETLGDELFTVDGTTSESLARSLVRANMDDWELAVYDALLAKVPSIANGSETSTVFKTDVITFTAKDLGLDSLIVYDSAEQKNVLNPEASNILGSKAKPCVEKALAAAMHTCPYEMYWFNKQGHIVIVEGTEQRCSYNFELAIGAKSDKGIETGTLTITLSLSVIDAYKGSSYFKTDSAKTAAAAQVAEKAKTVVAEAKDKSDQDKILYYKNFICDAVEYYIPQSSGIQTYGDTWQLIYVFDEDPTTDVYCEGYSKAFQYLCDLTEFEDDSIYCITVTGTLDNDDNNHMWNILHWSDGLNYLADITNSDTGKVGETGTLLRTRPNSGDLDKGYTFVDETNSANNSLYKYDENTRNIFPDSALSMDSEAGDLNGNGSIGTDDLIFLIKYILGSSKEPAVSTDVNNSGKTDLSDVMHLLRYLMGQEVTLHR